MSVSDAIKERRSVRRFGDGQIGRTELLKLLDAGRLAPTGGNRQPWRFVIVKEAQNIEAVKLMAPGLYGTPSALIVICSYGNKSKTSKDETYEADPVMYMDIGMAAENIMLLATELGIASCAIQSFNQVAVQSVLELPENIFPELVITLGFKSGEVKMPPKKTLEELACDERWDKAI